MTWTHKSRKDLIKHDNAELEIIVTIVKDRTVMKKVLRKIQWYEK